MKIFKYLIIGALCLQLMTPTEANIFKKIGNWFKGAGETIAKVAKKVAVPFCKMMTTVVCPTAVGLGATATIALTGGSAAPAAIVAGTTGVAGCHIMRKGCDKGKREAAPHNVVYYPISDDWDEYDTNDDDEIDYEEFAFDFLSRFKLANPQELRVVFEEADTDGDGRLDNDEFKAAAWYRGCK